MKERFERKTLYEFCETRKIMVRLEAIQSTVTMPDMVQAEVKLLPVGCNYSSECMRKGIRCLVFEPGGIDPCPGLWRGLD